MLPDILSWVLIISSYKENSTQKIFIGPFPTYEACMVSSRKKIYYKYRSKCVIMDYESDKRTR